MSGQWVYVGDPNSKAEVLAVHAALLPIGEAGQIVYYSGSQWTKPTEWDDSNETDPQHDPYYYEIDHSRIYDCQTGIVTNPHSPDADLFCSGHALLADGTLLIAGGTGKGYTDDPNPVNWHHSHWDGTRNSWIFDPNRPPYWIEAQLMNTNPNQGGFGGGRWYPTLITLPSGKIIAMCGHPSFDDDRHTNSTPELFDPATQSWRLLPQLGVDGAHDYAVYYPRLHVVPHTGEIFIVQPLYSGQVLPDTDPNSGNAAQGLCSSNPNDTNPSYTVNVMDKSLFYDENTQQVTRSFPGPQILDSLYLDHFFTSQETTSVLLPLLNEEQYHPRVLICGAEIPLIADLAPTSPNTLQWTPTAPRRYFASSVLLPTGDVVICGGVLAVPYTDAQGVKTAEIYHPLSPVHLDSWELGPVAHETRGYHSVALLTPDGRVWTAGSERNFQAQNNLAFELLEPDYFQVSDRIEVSQSPASVTYTQSFTVQFTQTSQNTPIHRVVLMRVGSSTHGFDGDQRYVSVPFIQTGSTLIVTAPPDATIAPPGYYMLWLVDTNNLPCKLAKFIRVVPQSCTLITDRNTFSKYEAHALAQGNSARISKAFYLVLNGFMPSEVGTITPTITFSLIGITATLNPTPPNPSLVNPTWLHGVQPITYVFDLNITDLSIFDLITDTETVQITAHWGWHTCSATMYLINSPNPYMVDGSTFWLSIDLHVFAMSSNEIAIYLPNGLWNGPHQFIQQLIGYYRGLSTINNHPFDQPPVSEDLNQLFLNPTRPDGRSVYNFAVAKVRYVSQTAPATNVRVLFRIFKTMTSALAYDNTTVYKQHTSIKTDPQGNVFTDAIAKLGMQGNEVISIPFFAEPRVTPLGDMNTQPDDHNVDTLQQLGSMESLSFFGCWLDINQPSSFQFPPPSNDRWQFQRGCSLDPIVYGGSSMPCRRSTFQPKWRFRPGSCW